MTSSNKLYAVTIQVTTVITAKKASEAMKESRALTDDALGRWAITDCKRIVTKDQLPRGWKENVIPWGDEEDVRSIRDYLLKK